jgi:phage tail tape-measure protein
VSTPTVAQAALVTAISGCLTAGLDPRLAFTEALNDYGATGGPPDLAQGNAVAEEAMTAAVTTILTNGMDPEVAFVTAYATLGPASGWQSLTPGQQALVDAPEVV